MCVCISYQINQEIRVYVCLREEREREKERERE